MIARPPRRSIGPCRVRCRALAGALACSALAAAAVADPMQPLAGPSTVASAASAVPAPASAAPAARARPALAAIRQDGEDGLRRALFGERWLGVGDRLGGYTVTAIGPSSVVLSAKSAQSTVYLLPPLQPALAPNAASGVRGTRTTGRLSP